MSTPSPTPHPLTAAPVRIIAALAQDTGRLELLPSASDPTFCHAQLLPESQLWDAAGHRLDPAALQVGDAIQLGGTLTPQRVLQVAWLRRCPPASTASA